MLRPRTFAVMTALVLAAPTLRAQAPDLASVLKRFAGTWTEDVSKRKLDFASLPPLRFRMGADRGLEEVLGIGPAEIVEKLVLDGKPFETPGGNSAAWKQLDAKRFERTITAKGEPIQRRTLTISDAGKTVTAETTGSAAEFVAQFVYQRVSGEGSGLVGEWKPVSQKVNALPLELTFEPVGPKSVRIIWAPDAAVTFELDGPPTAQEGRGASRPQSIQLKVRAASVLEQTTFIDGVVGNRTTFSIAADGKIMTFHSQALGAKVQHLPSCGR